DTFADRPRGARRAPPSRGASPPSRDGTSARARRTSLDSQREGRTGFKPSVPRRGDDAFGEALFASAALPVPPERPGHLGTGAAVRIPFAPAASHQAKQRIRVVSHPLPAAIRTAAG